MQAENLQERSSTIVGRETFGSRVRNVLRRPISETILRATGRAQRTSSTNGIRRRCRGLAGFGKLACARRVSARESLRGFGCRRSDTGGIVQALGYGTA